MNFEEFSASLQQQEPPTVLGVYLRALWYEGKNDWEKAHETIQDLNDRTAAWIHAYLHRKEGDIFNANYWYNKAGKRMPGYTLEQEWKEITTELLNSTNHLIS